MAKFVGAKVRAAIKAAIGANNRVYRWRRTDCVTLAIGVLAAQGIEVDLDAIDKRGILTSSSHEEALARVREDYSDLGDFLGSVLDGIPGLARVSSPYDWEAGMVGLTPSSGQYHVGFRLVDAEDTGAMIGVVDDRNVPVVMTTARGIVPVSKLWPRWADARTLTR